MSFTGGVQDKPWLRSKRHGCLLRKKEDHSMFENPWKNKYMCWIHGQVFKMKPAEVTIVKQSGGGTKEEVNVAGVEENVDLREWTLGEEPKDMRAEKFTLVNRGNGSMKISLKADTVEEAENWVREFQKVLAAVAAQEDPSGAAPRAGEREGKAQQEEKRGGRWEEGSSTRERGGRWEEGTRERTVPDPKNNFRRPDVDEVETQKLHGFHRFVYSNKDVYEGDWAKGMKHGSGTYTRADGTVYEGEYKKDKKHGQGRCTWTNDNTYVGQWADGAQHGHGILTCPDGRRYEGAWVSGKQQGRGTFSNAEGDIYVGEWKDGVKHGRGKMTSKDGHIYEGEWENNKKSGHGKHVRPDKSSYEGMWKDDKKDGQGTYVYSNGDIYKGETKNGHKHGYGVFRSANGASYSGWWKDGKKHGKGVYVSASGKEHKGWWKDDKPDPSEGAGQENEGAQEPPPFRPFGAAQGTHGGAARAPPVPGMANRNEYRAGGEGTAPFRRDEYKPTNAAPKAADANGDQKNNGNGDKKAQDAQEESNARADARAAEWLAENARMREKCASSAVMQDIGPKLDAVRKAGKTSVKTLIQHIYKFHPPRSTGKKETCPTDFSDATMKKTILLTIRLYHQDKNTIEAFDLEWHLLCREITKILNEKLELYK